MSDRLGLPGTPQKQFSGHATLLFSGLFDFNRFFRYQLFKGRRVFDVSTQLSDGVPHKPTQLITYRLFHSVCLAVDKEIWIATPDLEDEFRLKHKIQQWACECDEDIRSHYRRIFSSNEE